MSEQNHYAPNSPLYSGLKHGDSVEYTGPSSDFKTVEGKVSGTPDQFTGHIYVNLDESFGGGCIVVPPKSLARIKG